MVSGPSGFRKVWKIYAKKTRFYIRLFTYFKAGFPQIAEFRSTKISSLLKYCKNILVNFLINYGLFLLECFYIGSLKSQCPQVPKSSLTL